MFDLSHKLQTKSPQQHWSKRKIKVHWNLSPEFYYNKMPHDELIMLDRSIDIAHEGTENQNNSSVLSSADWTTQWRMKML